MKTLKIDLHSIVELITNSSSEIYIEATERSIEAIKSIIDNILQFSEKNLSSDDLFDIELGISYNDDHLGDLIADHLRDEFTLEENELLDDEQYDLIEKRLLEIDNMDPKPDWYDELINDNEEDLRVRSSINVKCKLDSPYIEEAGKLLNNLEQLFSYAEYS